MAEVVEREQYENTSGGWVGACTIDRHGEHRWIAVEPGGHVWLSEEERIAIANAPRNAADNPLIESQVDELDDDGKVIRTVTVEPALKKVTDARPIVANTRPIAPQGSYSEHEELGTPVAG